MSDAVVTLYAAGSGGYGGGDSVLGTGRSEADGRWSVEYMCPANEVQIYVVATGGNAGQGSNPALALSAAAGACASLPPSLTLNEATTVASTYALNTFLDPSGVHLGSAAGNLLGLRNAAGMVANLADVTTGQVAVSLQSQAPGAAPTAAVNTLADILAACVASPGAASAPCTTLLEAARGTDGAVPSTTLAAVLSIARHPGSQVDALYGLASSSAPFQPILSSAPSDWLLPVVVSGGGLSAPEAVAIDAQGNAWVANYSPVVAKLSPLGAPLFGSGFTGGGLEESYGIAIDAAGHVWVTNQQSPGGVNVGLGSITELDADGRILSGPTGYVSPIPAGSADYVSGILFPQALAAAPDGTLWVANTGDGSHHSFLAQLAPDGSFLSSASGFMGGGLAFPVSLAIDAQGAVWVADRGGDNVALFSAAGMPLSPASGYRDVGGVQLNVPDGICLDPDGHAWVSLSLGNAVIELQGSADPAPGTPLSAAGGFTGGGLTQPAGCAADGAGRIWVANYHGASVTELQGAADPDPGSPLSGSLGFAAGQLASPTAVAVDPSGNVWITNSTAIVSTLTVLVGAAMPVRTPLAGPPMRP